MRKFLVTMCGVSLMAMSAYAQDDDHVRDFRNKLIGKGPLINTAISALYGEVVNSPREWGRGIDGLGKRAASAYGKRTIQATVELGVSTWTHEDLRYRRLGEGSVMGRVKHGTLGTFWVRRDNGTGNTLAVGRIAGAFTAAQVQRTWMPARVDTFGSGMRSFGSSLGLKVGFNLVREFWPRKR